MNFVKHDWVIKKSRKPFKSGMQIEQITKFGENKNDPKQRKAAIFKDDSVCNLDQLELVITEKDSFFNVFGGVPVDREWALKTQVYREYMLNKHKISI